MKQELRIKWLKIMNERMKKGFITNKEFKKEIKSMKKIGIILGMFLMIGLGSCQKEKDIQPQIIIVNGQTSNIDPNIVNQQVTNELVGSWKMSNGNIMSLNADDSYNYMNLQAQKIDNGTWYEYSINNVVYLVIKASFDPQNPYIYKVVGLTSHNLQTENYSPALGQTFYYTK